MSTKQQELTANKSEKSNRDTKTRRAIVDLLKFDGGLDAKGLATRLGVTDMAVRLHLYQLRDEGLVESTNEPRPRGRPAKIWGLTAAANRFFPDGHADLIVGLFESMQEAFGEAALDQLLAVRSARQVADYTARFGDDASLEERLQSLADVRTSEGYMASIQLEEDGAYLLVENHCPICSAAATCQGLCRNELSVFRRVLGKGVDVERIDHIMAGARRCTYRVVATS